MRLVVKGKRCYLWKPWRVASLSTSNSAMADYIHEETAYPVRSVYFADQLYALPVVSDLKDKLWHVYQNRKEAQRKGKLVRKYIQTHRSLQVCCSRMINRLREVA